VDQAEIENQVATPCHRVLALEPGQPRYRLLIVDDQPANRHLLVKLLGPLGFELREAENGQKAIDIWQEFEPHLIWMDMRMPVLDGYQATQRIKATTKGQATAIIALTASSFEEERAIVLSAGCDDFLRKPFREAEIFEMMRKHIGVRYIYEASGTNGELFTAREQPKLEALKPEIRALPAELLARLSEGTELGDTVMINDVTTEIRRYNPILAERLAQLARNFEYDRLLNFIQGVDK
jgi:CheY-like chemotaxis protein